MRPNMSIRVVRRMNRIKLKHQEEFEMVKFLLFRIYPLHIKSIYHFKLIYLQRSPQQSHPAAPHLADLANYDRRRRSEREERRDRDRSNARDKSAHRGMPVARVSANVATGPLRKMSEPVLHPQQARPETLWHVNFPGWEVRHLEVGRGGISPPPPAPPPRDTSIGNVSDMDDDSLGSTLRGPNKPLPPTPTEQSPAAGDADGDGTLQQHRRNGAGVVRPIMVKAASMPDQAVCTPPEFGMGENSSDSDDDQDIRSSIRRPFGPNPLLPQGPNVTRGNGPLAMPDLLPKTPEFRRPFDEHTNEDHTEELTI
uniref:Miff domain-containing protein n=1 Tax=Heterorhabditis bacteriophora TaxID=37862 RepID=A0A1I7X5Z9_HETBA